MKQALTRRPRLTALIVVVAIVAAVGMKVTSHSIPTGAATVQLMVDSPESSLADLKQDTLPLIARAQVFAQLMSSGAVLDSIATAARVPSSEVTAEGPYSGVGQPLDVPTPSEARSVQLIATNAPYHFTFVPDANIPMVTASVQGPSPASAAKLANAVYPGIKTWLTSLQQSGSVPPSLRVTVRQLGDAQAGSVNASSATTVAGIAAVAVLLIGFLVLMTLENRRVRRERESITELEDQMSNAQVAPVPPGSNGDGDSELLDVYGFAAAGEPRASANGTNGHFGTQARAAHDLAAEALDPAAAPSTAGPHPADDHGPSSEARKTGLGRLLSG